MAAAIELSPVRAWRSARPAWRNPTDDITRVLMHADVDGERLTTQEFGSFFILLVWRATRRPATRSATG